MREKIAQELTFFPIPPSPCELEQIQVNLSSTYGISLDSHIVLTGIFLWVWVNLEENSVHVYKLVL